MATSAKLKDLFYNCGVCECETLHVLAHLLRDGTERVFEACTANKMSTNAHVCDKIRPAIANALSKRF